METNSVNPLRDKKPHYLILVHEPWILKCLYSSAVLVLATWSYQITPFTCSVVAWENICTGQWQSSWQVETLHQYNQSGRSQKLGLNRRPGSNKVSKSDKGSHLDKEVKVRPKLGTYLILPAFYPSNPNAGEDYWAPQELQAHSYRFQLLWGDWEMDGFTAAASKQGTRGERTTLLTTQTKDQPLHSYSHTKQQLNLISQLSPPSYRVLSGWPCSPYHCCTF